ncbi:type II toxin-antitoxin system ParD family antitoxin [Pseudoroseicyclus aestuarii]|uniref:Antitoxin ParD1/3/4 n=1 Tax=Pseudoroseicyclus aestuarii TaxID=1795041 RepID=A0A318SRN8_9RHOB|nr:type II toxin-antitoxin system ParD family antitoxin [Pseudoroseicyclus aestuarii]PYE80625.1 antitoxin ParD1/3/4 [Pseudoroseicyclus aestuarii]
MATMNVSLPDPMKSWVETRADGNRFANASDYVRHLIRQDQEREEARAALQAAVDQALASGPARPLDRAALRARIRGEL